MSFSFMAPPDGSAEAPAVVLAPLSGLTDAPFRRLVAGFGASWVVSEMVPGDCLARGFEEARLRVEGSGLARHVVQIAGCQPHWMAEGARVAVASGAHVVDINMGCPAKRVTGGYGGSALMRDLELASRLIEATVTAVEVPVTVKMRLGWDAASHNAADLARSAETLGASLVTVHGRTRQQFYSGRADWAAVRAVVEAVSIPVLVNGDIDSPATARTALAQSGASGVMIGRAALGRPWLIAQVQAALSGRPVPPEPDLATKGRIARDLYAAHLDHYGVRMGLKHARKHLASALDHAAAGRVGEPGFASARLAALTATTPEAAFAHLDEAFDRLAWRNAA